MKRCIALLLGLVLLSVAVRPASALYQDVHEGDWFYSNVVEMTGLGLLKGYSDGSFRPNQTITAAEFVTIVSRCAGLSETGIGEVAHWAGPVMVAARSRGWYDYDEILPSAEAFNAPIQRQIAVKVLMRALLPEATGTYEESKKIKDFDLLSGRYYESTFAAYAVGVLRGNGNGTMKPTRGLSRAEACALVVRARNISGGGSFLPPEEPPVQAVSGGVSENGALQVIGTQLCNAEGEPVLLRGMSSHGIAWFPKYAGEAAIAETARRGANVYRVAMYTGEYGGYITNPGIKNTVIQAVDAAIRNDMYVIIDWHILSDGDPRAHQTESIAFFQEMARRYRGNPAVIYEICNEPNGGVTWSGAVKPYAEAVIPAIRAIDPAAVILVGTPNWSQDVDAAARDPLPYRNIMYTLHFYAGTHGAVLLGKLDAALKLGAPVFVSEWGTSQASGAGGVYLEAADAWLNELEERGISWVNWSLCDKNESSAALMPGAPAGGWSEGNLSPSGRYVMNRLARSLEETR